jgi:branched-chain amino acid transport system permease protein
LPPTWLKYVAKHYLVAYAIFVMVLLVFSPSGVLGFFDRRLAARRAAAASAAREAKPA